MEIGREIDRPQNCLRKNLTSTSQNLLRPNNFECRSISGVRPYRSRGYLAKSSAPFAVAVAVVNLQMFWIEIKRRSPPKVKKKEYFEGRRISLYSESSGLRKKSDAINT